MAICGCCSCCPLKWNGDREAILGLKPKASHHPRDVSYLRWYQAIALAGGGDGEGSRRMAIIAFSEDAKIMDRPDCSGIGRRQYRHPRRFLEHFACVLCNPSMVGHIYFSGASDRASSNGLAASPHHHEESSGVHA